MPEPFAIPPDSIRNVATRHSVCHTDAEICVNCWYFVDSTGTVLRLAARAYALAGTDEEKLTILKALAATDHLTAIQARVPERYMLTSENNQYQGAIPAAAIQMDPLPVFDDLFNEITKSLPELMRAPNDEYVKFKAELKEPFLWVMTAVYEDPDGTLIARIS